MGPHAWRMSEQGSPLLEGAIAWVDCRTRSILDGGDHKIFVGEVMGCEVVRPDADPLLFFRGRYRAIGRRGGVTAAALGGTSPETRLRSFDGDAACLSLISQCEVS